ncbi:MAG: DUF1727 domain-containing protein [Eggerthellaceae bacterium]|nr:DUF1727 domain-containing protein [Eggerthellaceae bacterium]
MNAKVLTAIVLGKAAGAIMRLFGRGSSFPGALALRICPELLGILAKDVRVAVVTGTNGKTTTCHMIAKILMDEGNRVLANEMGANMASGIASAFVFRARLNATVDADYAVIECDEASLVHVASALKPFAVVVTNVFRDQLDRYGEITTTLDIIKQGLKLIPSSLLVVNADCSLCASLGDLPNKIVYYGLSGAKEFCAKHTSAQEVSRCIKCGAPYQYEYRLFAHLGGFYCKECGYKRPEPDLEALSVKYDDKNQSIVDVTVKGSDKVIKLNLSLPGMFNIHNALAALCVAKASGIEYKNALASLSLVDASFGRMERFVLSGTEVCMVLVKNPTGADLILSFLMQNKRYKRVVFGLNDNPADGEDISWIWDASFESIYEQKDFSFSKTYVMGTRSSDMALRLKYAGADASSIHTIHETKDVASVIEDGDEPICLVLNYTSMLQTRRFLDKHYRLGGLR